MSLQKVLLVDLDGTLLNTNTFHKYIYFILKYYFPNEAHKTCLILFLALSRLARIISHAQLKYRILKVTKGLPEYAISTFVQSLENYKDPRVLKIMDNYDGLKILASAAPKNYSQFLGKIFGFDAVLATENPGNSAWEENIRENKKRSLLRYLGDAWKGKYEFDLLVTDHHDDLCLMEMFKQTLLVNPSLKTISLTQHLKNRIKVMGEPASQ